MSSEWDQTCLVCGSKTENRCSSCAKAGIDLFFCSPDHQKLVWKAHRRVCGPGKANPFMWPLLSQHEADEIVEHMHESTGLLGTSAFQTSTVASALQQYLKLNDERTLQELIQNLIVGATRSMILSSELEQDVLVYVRALETVRRTSRYNDDLFYVPCVDSITSLAYHDQLFLLDLWDRSAGKDVPVEWFERLFARYNEFLRTEVAPLHPQLAEKLLKRKPASELLAARLAVYGGAAA